MENQKNTLGRRITLKIRKINDTTINCIISQDDLKKHGIDLDDLFDRKKNAVEFIKRIILKAASSVNMNMKNAAYIKNGLAEAGYTVSGGVNAPYIWLKTPDGMTSWDFFDYLLENANVVGTPGSGFGPSGEGHFRLTAFGSYENTVEAIDRIKNL